MPRAPPNLSAPCFRTYCRAATLAASSVAPHRARRRRSCSKCLRRLARTACARCCTRRPPKAARVAALVHLQTLTMRRASLPLRCSPRQCHDVAQGTVPPADRPRSPPAGRCLREPPCSICSAAADLGAAARRKLWRCDVRSQEGERDTALGCVDRTAAARPAAGVVCRGRQADSAVGAALAAGQSALDQAGAEALHSRVCHNARPRLGSMRLGGQRRRGLQIWPTHGTAAGRACPAARISGTRTAFSRWDRTYARPGRAGAVLRSQSYEAPGTPRPHSSSSGRSNTRPLVKHGRQVGCEAQSTEPAACAGARRWLQCLQRRRTAASRLPSCRWSALLRWLRSRRPPHASARCRCVLLQSPLQPPAPAAVPRACIPAFGAISLSWPDTAWHVRGRSRSLGATRGCAPLLRATSLGWMASFWTRPATRPRLWPCCLRRCRCRRAVAEHLRSPWRSL